MPEATGAEEHLIRILKQIESVKPHHVIVDAISGSLRIGTEKAAFDFMMRLVLGCKEQGITCIYSNQTMPGSAVHNTSGLGISSLVDTVLLLEQVWIEDVHERRILILKSRGSKHSSRFHSFAITDHGLKVEASGAKSSSIGEKIR